MQHANEPIIRRQVRVVDDHPPGLSVANRIFQFRDFAKRVKQPPALLHQLLQEVGLADAGLADDDQVAPRRPQPFELSLAPDPRHRRRRRRGQRDAGQRTGHSGDAEQVPTPPGVPVEEVDELALIVDLMQRHPVCLSQFAPEPLAHLTIDRPGGRQDNQAALASRVEMALDALAEVAGVVPVRGRDDESAAAVRQLEQPVLSGVVAAGQRAQARVVVAQQLDGTAFECCSVDLLLDCSLDCLVEPVRHGPLPPPAPVSKADISSRIPRGPRRPRASTGCGQTQAAS